MRRDFLPDVTGALRSHMIEIPNILFKCPGIIVNGKKIRNFAFTTDVAIIRNINSDAIIAVYPFTPQPVITRAIMETADVPVFCGVGGGVTHGLRSVNVALHAEFQGAAGVVLNAPVPNTLVEEVANSIDIPVAVTVVDADTDIAGRINAGAKIINVSGAAKTPSIVRRIREEFPNVPIIATGGASDEAIAATIAAGANCITYTPPTTGELLNQIMQKYRN